MVNTVTKHLAKLAALALLLFSACSSGVVTTTDRVLVVDKSFDLKSTDPHRELDATGALVAKALYSTLLTFRDGDEATPEPWVASSYSSSADARVFTFKLRRDVVFSDGTPLSASDVVFSLNRVINLKGPPSLLLAGVSASAPDSTTIVLKSNDPDPAIPFILTNPALAIVNSTTVKSHGGSDQPGADKTDRAGDFLNGSSAGSGPYILQSFSTFSDIELTVNRRYWGPKPFYRKVVIRNMSPTTQLAYVASATDQVALDLTPAQAGTLIANRSVVIDAFSAPEVVFLFTNDDPQVSTTTANKHFQAAVRYALDYSAMVQLMGTGAIQAPGVVPNNLLGALPAWAAPLRDIGRATAELLASGIKNPTVNLGFANDLALSGLPLSALASMVKNELEAAGIKVSLTGSPSSAATADFNAATQQMGLWYVTEQSADPNQYLAFLPGRLLGLRAGWPAGADPSLETLGALAGTTPDLGTRAQLFQLIQGQLNAEGPFFPLLQPGRMIVATRGITTIAFNPTWSIDVAAVRN